jgi:serine protease inhibitor ecotin
VAEAELVAVVVDSVVVEEVHLAVDSEEVVEVEVHVADSVEVEVGLREVGEDLVVGVEEGFSFFYFINKKYSRPNVDIL